MDLQISLVRRGLVYPECFLFFWEFFLISLFFIGTVAGAPGSFDLVFPDNDVMITSDNRVTLDWGSSSGVDYYEVWLNIDKKGGCDWTESGDFLNRYNKIAEVSSGTTQYTTSELQDRWTYKWYVVAVDGTGAGTKSSSVREFGLYTPVLESYSDGVSIVDGCRDLNKNLSVEPFENWKLPVGQRVDDLLSRMTNLQKALRTTYNFHENLGSAFYQYKPYSTDGYNEDQAAIAENTEFSIPWCNKRRHQ